eukprot:TRINITY_DN14690_c0_g1_i1.p1 TRINITY_DN14690_c0_g1~~TRINITY_DN14690_c0_g1_i1.p1  ORF type:complete len:980 (+),score=173.27 TRINITY_DN14690_c0_g1_i1:85-3024(+)
MSSEKLSDAPIVGDVNKYALPPVWETLQRIAVYETRTKFYLVGSDNAGLRYRILKIDRTDPYVLNIEEDRTTFTRREINSLVAQIESGNKGSFSKACVGFGLLGIVRFLEGHYLYIITKRRLLGWIGGHAVYGIDDAALLPIPHKSVMVQSNSDESRYKNLFLSLDVTRDFYYSYTYDLTLPLQTNMKRREVPPCERFIWNRYLMSPLQITTFSTWSVTLLHGFFEQHKLSMFGRNVTLTLLARRSRCFAGTRYRKRGISEDGDVANEVEIEQIVHEEDVGSHRSGHFASFVQVRGSIPLFWSQDTSAVVPKPPISLDKVDPFYISTRLHFTDLMSRHGAPIVVLNLVKQEEKQARETILGKEFATACDHLNVSLPPDAQIEYMAVDMKHQGKRTNVLLDVMDAARAILHRTGFFHSGPLMQCNAEGPPSHRPPPGGRWYGPDHIGREQTGTVRTNCIDSLDRTNVAQFIVSRVALASQLHAMGISTEPVLDDRSEVLDALKTLYDEIGDALALQYGGSNAVKSSASYAQRGLSKTAQQSRDLITSLKRYYSNAFVDAARQDAMNVFLGVFIPAPDQQHIWQIDDHFLHNPPRLRMRTCVDMAWGNRALTYYEEVHGQAAAAIDATTKPAASASNADDEPQQHDVPQPVASPRSVASPASLSVITAALRASPAHMLRPGSPLSIMSAVSSAPLPTGPTLQLKYSNKEPDEEDAYFSERHQVSRLTSFDDELAFTCNTLKPARLYPPPEDPAPWWPYDGLVQRRDTFVVAAGQVQKDQRLLEKEQFERYLDTSQFMSHQSSPDDVQLYAFNYDIGERLLAPSHVPTLYRQSSVMAIGSAPRSEATSPHSPRPVQPPTSNITPPRKTSSENPAPPRRASSGAVLVSPRSERRVIESAPETPLQSMQQVDAATQDIYEKTLNPDISPFHECRLSNVEYARLYVNPHLLLHADATRASKQCYEAVCSQEVHVHYDSVIYVAGR